MENSLLVRDGRDEGAQWGASLRRTSKGPRRVSYFLIPSNSYDISGRKPHDGAPNTMEQQGMEMLSGALIIASSFSSCLLI